jgi:hypothetical protein
MIKKVYSFKVLSRREDCFYSLFRNPFAENPFKQAFIMRKSKRDGMIIESEIVNETTAGMILSLLLTERNDVEIEYFSYSITK